MFTISNDNGIIAITKGDTLRCPLFINSMTDNIPTRYVLTNSDILTFRILYPGTDEYLDNNVDGVIETEPVLQHIYSNDGAAGHIAYTLNENNDIIIDFTSDEINTLKEGTYYYEVKLQYKPDAETTTRIDTIIPRTKFYVVLPRVG
jgi:hypothetical protein